MQQRKKLYGATELQSCEYVAFDSELLNYLTLDTTSGIHTAACTISME